MNPVEVILLHELASHRKVWLPGVGTLGVVMQPSKFEGKKLLKPPFNKVEFSSKEDSAERSVISLLKRNGMNSEEAEQLYKEWLENARKGRNITIDSVGELKGGFLSLAPKLNALLNPSLESVIVKAKGGKCTALVVTLILAAIIAGAGFWWWKTQYTGAGQSQYTHSGAQNDTDTSSDNNTSATDGNSNQIGQVYADSTVNGQTNTSENINSDHTDGTISLDGQSSTETGSHASGQGTLNSANEADTAVSHVGLSNANSANNISPEAKNDGANVQNTALPRYYIVGGVFSVDENADKYIAKMRKRFPNINYEKTAYPKNKIMVSLFSTTDSDEANRMRKQMAREMNNGDLWIHKATK